MRTCENKRALPNFLRLRRRPTHESHTGVHPSQKDIMPFNGTERRTKLKQSTYEWPIESSNPWVRQRIHRQYERVVVNTVLGRPMSQEWTDYGKRKRETIGKVFPLFVRARVQRASGRN